MEAMIFPVLAIIFIALLMAWHGTGEYSYYYADIVFTQSDNVFKGIAVACLNIKQKRKKRISAIMLKPINGK